MRAVKQRYVLIWLELLMFAMLERNAHITSSYLLQAFGSRQEKYHRVTVSDTAATSAGGKIDVVPEMLGKDHR